MYTPSYLDVCMYFVDMILSKKFPTKVIDPDKTFFLTKKDDAFLISPQKYV